MQTALKEQQQQPVNAAPDDEGPGRAVPQAAEQHGEEEIHVCAGVAQAVAAERDVQVVAQPGGERDVPAPPELARVAREVGLLEVEGQLVAE